MTEPLAETAAPAAKVDPESLALRARPRPVIRFRREAIIAAALLGAGALGGVAWLGLKPVQVGSGMSADSQAEPRRGGPWDALGKAPMSYGDIPKLGPPLPGDLGKPILDHQRSLAEPRTPVEDPALHAAQAAEAERQRAAAEQKAARESAVLVDTGGAGPVGATAPVAEAPAARASSPDEGTAARTGHGDQAGKQAFLARRADAAAVDPGRLAPAALPTVLSAGSVIAASLVTGLNSDLPGFVIAQVTQPVFDSPTGRTMLIPQGARLLGRYDSAVAFGQTRALVVWQRILMPDGSAIAVDNLPATDTQGFAGLADRIDLHSWQFLKGVGLSTLLGVGTQLSLGDESDLVRALRESAQQSGARAGDRLVQRALDVQPTITVRPGWPLRVILHKDLVLPPWTGAQP